MRKPRAPDFEKRNVKLIGISANGLDDHEKWVEDINEWGAKYGPTNVQFPIVRSTWYKYTFRCANLNVLLDA